MARFQPARGGPGGHPLWQHTCGGIYAIPPASHAGACWDCGYCRTRQDPAGWQPLYVPLPETPNLAALEIPPPAGSANPNPG